MDAGNYFFNSHQGCAGGRRIGRPIFGRGPVFDFEEAWVEKNTSNALLRVNF
jgi:hypothetical protein